MSFSCSGRADEQQPTPVLDVFDDFVSKFLAGFKDGLLARAGDRIVLKIFVGESWRNQALLKDSFGLSFCRTTRAAAGKVAYGIVERAGVCAVSDAGHKPTMNRAFGRNVFRFINRASGSWFSWDHHDFLGLGAIR